LRARPDFRYKRTIGHKVNVDFTDVRDLGRPMTRDFGMSTRSDFRALKRGADEARTAAALILGILLLRRP